MFDGAEKNGNFSSATFHCMTQYKTINLHLSATLKVWGGGLRAKTKREAHAVMNAPTLEVDLPRKLRLEMI